MDIVVEELDGGLWVAATEGGRLQGLEVDPGKEDVRWGSIYWAKVVRIDKAMDAAFVQLDNQNEGLLHNADVRTLDKAGNVIKGGEQAISKALRPGQMIAVQLDDAALIDSGVLRIRNGLFISALRPRSDVRLGGVCERLRVGFRSHLIETLETNADRQRHPADREPRSPPRALIPQ